MQHLNISQTIKIEGTPIKNLLIALKYVGTCLINCFSGFSKESKILNVPCANSEPPLKANQI